jgi:hypothetical protein
MTARIKWLDRAFFFEFPTDYYPEIMARLRGAPARTEDLVQEMPARILTMQPGNKWSVLEHIGHLILVETLFIARLDDYDARLDTLTPADFELGAKKMKEARYNEKMASTLLKEFRQVRGRQIARMEKLAPEDFGRAAFHPRLQVPMRLVDSMYFFAEHDDYHLARIFEQAGQLAS